MHESRISRTFLSQFEQDKQLKQSSWLLLVAADNSRLSNGLLLFKISWFFWCHLCWKLVVLKMETCRNLKGHRDVIFLLVVSDRQTLHHFTPKNGFKHEPIRNRWWYSMTKSTLIFLIAVVSIYGDLGGIFRGLLPIIFSDLATIWPKKGRIFIADF